MRWVQEQPRKRNLRRGQVRGLSSGGLLAKAQHPLGEWRGSWAGARKAPEARLGPEVGDLKSTALRHRMCVWCA